MDTIDFETQAWNRRLRNGLVRGYDDDCIRWAAFRICRRFLRLDCFPIRPMTYEVAWVSSHA